MSPFADAGAVARYLADAGAVAKYLADAGAVAKYLAGMSPALQAVVVESTRLP